MDCPVQDPRRMSPPSPEPAPGRPIARQLALGLTAIGVVAVVMCGVLLSIIHDVSGLVSGMRHDEGAIRRGLELATSVREHGTIVVGVLLDPDDARVAAYDVSRQSVRARIQQLAAIVPEAERWRVEALGEKTQRVHDVFVAALPSARLGNRAAVLEAHRSIEGSNAEAAAHADALAKAVESRMAHSHVLATDSARRGLLAGSAFVLLIVLLCVAFMLRLRSAVFRPLVALTNAARRVGKGEFHPHTGDLGEGELATLGTAFQRMANELEQRQVRLVHSERMAAIGQLAAGVAHELNNPIGIIRGYLKTMNPEGDVETLREELAIVDEESSHCQRIAEDLLSYARATQLVVSRVSARSFLSEIVERSRGTEPLRSREVVFDAQDVEIEIDTTRLRQVVSNLLLNASQASPDTAPIGVRGRVDGAAYHIDVEDRGEGVAPEDRDRVFEPFFSKRRGGSGLGLSVVLGIVQAHRGAIGVVDREGGGSVFRVRLPLRQPSATSRDESGAVQ